MYRLQRKKVKGSAEMRQCKVESSIVYTIRIEEIFETNITMGNDKFRLS